MSTQLLRYRRRGDGTLPVRDGVCIPTRRRRYADVAEAAVARAARPAGSRGAGAILLRCDACRGVHLGHADDSVTARRWLRPVNERRRAEHARRLAEDDARRGQAPTRSQRRHAEYLQRVAARERAANAAPDNLVDQSGQRGSDKSPTGGVAAP